MKKVVFYTSGIELGGVEKVLLEILKRLDKKKFEISVGFYSDNNKYFEDELPNNINYKYMTSSKILKRIDKLKNGNIIDKKIIRSLLKKYYRYKKDSNYRKIAKDKDIIIDFKNLIYYKKIVKYKAKKICWLHGSLEIEFQLNSNEQKEKLYNKLKNFHKIICICEEMKKELINFFPDLENKVEVVYNLIDFKGIKEMSTKKNDLLEEEKKLLKEEYMLMVSRYDMEQKDFITLINAYKIYDNILGEKSIKLYLLGEGPDREKLKNIISKNKLENKILLLGAKKNPYVWMNSSKFMIHSSKCEGFGLVLLEGLSLGKIIIASNCKIAPKEILDNGKYGILFQVGDEKELATKMLEISEKNSLLKAKLEKIIKLELEDYLKKFNDKLIIKKIENILLS